MQNITIPQLKLRLINAFDAFANSEEYTTSFIFGGNKYKIEDNKVTLMGSGLSYDLGRNPDTGRKIYSALRVDEYTLPAVLDNNDKIIELLILD